MNLQALVDSWILFHEIEVNAALEGRQAAGSDDYSWANTLLDNLCKKDPLVALELIDRIFAATNNERVLACLGAGPLEDLLVAHGEVLLANIERRAHADLRYRDLLSCVSLERLNHPVSSVLRALLTE